MRHSHTATFGLSKNACMSFLTYAKLRPIVFLFVNQNLEKCHVSAIGHTLAGPLGWLSKSYPNISGQWSWIGHTL